MTDQHHPRSVTDLAGIIVEVVTGAEPDLETSTITAAVVEVAATKVKQRVLAQALLADPELLTSARPHGPRSIERLIQALLARGAVHVVLPECARCRRTRPLVAFDANKQRICGSCDVISRTRFDTCVACRNRRAVATLDRDGAPRCKSCPPEQGHDHTAEIIDHILQVTGDIEADRLRELVEQSLPQKFQRREVAWELAARPELLCGAAAEGSPRLIKLVERLSGDEVPGIIAPACPFCGNQAPLKHRRDAQRCCRRCYDACNTETCCGCGKDRPVTIRTAEGEPLCASCRQQSSFDFERCDGCGEDKFITHRDSELKLCKRCWRAHTAVCSICGKTKPCHFAFSDAPRCESCSNRLKLGTHPCVSCGRTRPVSRRSPQGPLCNTRGRRRAPCCRCGITKPVIASVPDGPLCVTCYRAEPAFMGHCHDCGVFEHLHHFGRCARCACSPLLREALTGPSGQVHPDHEPLVRILLDTTNPQWLLEWLDRRGGSAALTALAATPGPLTHEVFDALPQAAKLTALRQVLVAAQLLPARDEHLRNLESWIEQTVATVDDPDERSVLLRYIRWVPPRRLRFSGRHLSAGRRPPGGNQKHHQIPEVVARQRISIKCLWSSRYRHLAQRRTRRQATDPRIRALGSPTRCCPQPRGSLPAHQHHQNSLRRYRPALALAQRLMQDDALTDRDRVAGLLVLLYAQPVSRISQLTTDHVIAAEQGVQLKLGRKPLDLPPPLDELVQRLTTNRRGYASLGHTNDNPWLFPGGIPGQPISTAQLAFRLKQIGVPPRIGRNSALMHLSSELADAVISDLLGISISAASHWASIAGNSHNGYTAELAHQQHYSKAPCHAFARRTPLLAETHCTRVFPSRLGRLQKHRH